jgi:hypothetical protein
MLAPEPRRVMDLIEHEDPHAAKFKREHADPSLEKLLSDRELPM